MTINKVLVVGMGLMGSGIAQVCAQSGFETYVFDISKEAGEKGLRMIGKTIEKRVEKGKLSSEEKHSILGRLKLVDRLEEVKDADLVIEAVFENFDLKKEVFAQLGKMMPPNTILASNTSALPATPLAAASGRPDKFIIIHFHQPPQVMRLIELVRAIQTSEETAKTAREFCKKIDKDVCELKVDCPGFLTNRTMVALLNEVYYCLYEGVATKEDIDMAFKSGFNWPMGPLELSDFIGLDTLLHITEDLNKRRGGDKYVPCPLLVNMVAAGYLGRKSGKGFFDYSK
ncbi:MAG: 3-hydroxyacyl-CoA dehydrogenase family protein [Thermodesulfobacteriota bacterium]|nr:3-hydroxyacyl-CoA dehydrogenase family protein [Thermodesulfobacteriota bacterium]